MSALQAFIAGLVYAAGPKKAHEILEDLPLETIVRIVSGSTE